MSLWNAFFHGITSGQLDRQSEKLEAIDQRLRDLNNNLGKGNQQAASPGAPARPAADQYKSYGGPEVGGVKLTDGMLDDSYYRANMEGAEKAEREGRTEDAVRCRRLADAFRTGGKDAAISEGFAMNREQWRKMESEAISRGDYARASYCSQKASECHT